MRSGSIASLLLAGSLLLAACGAGGAPAGGGASGPSAAAPGSSAGPGAAAPPSGAAPLPAPASVTQADDNRTISMHVGGTFLLDLGTGLRWSPHVADPRILAQVPDVPVPLGAQGVYRALRAGSTTLAAAGSPVCGQGKACPMFVLSFHVGVVVTGG